MIGTAGVGRDYVALLRLGRGSFETREADELSKPEEAATAHERDVWRWQQDCSACCMFGLPPRA